MSYLEDSFALELLTGLIIFAPAILVATVVLACWAHDAIYALVKGHLPDWERRTQLIITRND